jgi:hypothetical protein
MSLVRAVQMGFCENDVDSSTRLVEHFVRRVLNEFEKLAVAISSLGDTALSVGVLGYETRVHRVSLQDTRGLFENGLKNRRGRRHGFCAP